MTRGCMGLRPIFFVLFCFIPGTHSYVTYDFVQKDAFESVSSQSAVDVLRESALAWQNLRKNDEKVGLPKYSVPSFFSCFSSTTSSGDVWLARYLTSDPLTQTQSTCYDVDGNRTPYTAVTNLCYDRGFYNNGNSYYYLSCVCPNRDSAERFEDEDVFVEANDVITGTSCATPTVFDDARVGVTKTLTFRIGDERVVVQQRFVPHASPPAPPPPPNP